MVDNLLGNNADIKLTYAIVPLNKDFKGDEFFKFFKYANDRLSRALPDMSKATGPIIDMVKKVPKGSPGFTDINKFMDKLEAFEMPKDVFKPTPFAGWAMSIMFAGMAMQRMFDTIWKSSTKTFNDIMHSVEGTSTKFDMLSGSTAYLGFTIGQALEPVIDYIIPIVDAIANWVEENPKLTATLIVLMGVLGTMAMVGGSLQLAYNGFKDLFVILTQLSGFNMGGFLGGLTLTSPFIIALAVVVASMLAFNKAMEESPAFKENFKSNVMTPLINSFKELGTAIDDLFKQIFNGNGLLDTLGGLFLIVARLALINLVPALVIVAETLGNIVKAGTAVWSVLKGDLTGAAEAWNSIDWNASSKAIESATSDLDKLLSSLSEGEVTISGQMKAYSTPSTTNTEQGFSSYVPSTINNYYLLTGGSDFDRIIAEAQRGGLR